jgi:predicted transcriptional regulator
LPPQYDVALQPFSAFRSGCPGFFVLNSLLDYSPRISEAEYNDWATHDLISRVYHGSARDLVAALVRSDGLTQSDIDELRDLFKLED